MDKWNEGGYLAMLSEKPARNKCVFLSGGSGVFGQALLEKLPYERVICLTHQRSVPGHNVRRIKGDITKPHLGLSENTYQELVNQIDWIIHCAAQTDFARPRHELWEVNVRGTQHILDLGIQAQVPLYHVSTAFIRPTHNTQGDSELNHYETAKRAAEQLVRESQLAYAIVRPSLILGDSVSGRIPAFQGFHHFIKLFMKGFLPVAPASPNSLVDFMPHDYLARVLIAMLENRTQSRTQELLH
jgi:thioester reductase-like protein